MCVSIHRLAQRGDLEGVRRELHSNPAALNQPDDDYVSDIVMGPHIENHNNNVNMADGVDPPALCSMGG